MRLRAFTLIELLVVVAIIAVLIAILLPSLGRAKANAVRVQCAANLNQWGKAVTMYQSENDGWWGIQERIDGKHKLFWNTVALNNEPSLYDEEWSNDLITGGKVSAELRTCPGDPQYGAINAGGGSYPIMKGIGQKRPAVDYTMPRYYSSPGVANPNTLWRISQFTHPGTTVLILDGPPNDQSTSNHNMSLYYAFNSMNDLDTSYAPDSTLENSLKLRHNGIGNVCFLDGHVEQHIYQDYCDNIPSASDPYDKNTQPDATKHWIDMQN
jgi:prepilin-type N-terminal cleavage/methylation domain-containing protein/prepilin-type processing-associated H-X9-DG protein